MEGSGLSRLYFSKWIHLLKACAVPVITPPICTSFPMKDRTQTLENEISHMDNCLIPNIPVLTFVPSPDNVSDPPTVV